MGIEEPDFFRLFIALLYSLHIRQKKCNKNLNLRQKKCHCHLNIRQKKCIIYNKHQIPG